MGVDFEYDEDFRRTVAQICGSRYISKKNLQLFVLAAMTHVISSEDVSLLRKEMEE